VVLQRIRRSRLVLRRLDSGLQSPAPVEVSAPWKSSTRVPWVSMIAIDAGHLKGNVCWKLGAEIYIGVLQTKDLSATVNEKTKGCNASAVLVAAGNSMAYQAALSILAPSHFRNRGMVQNLETRSAFFIHKWPSLDPVYCPRFHCITVRRQSS
jgi:hypothetical protein